MKHHFSAQKLPNDWQRSQQLRGPWPLGAARQRGVRYLYATASIALQRPFEGLILAKKSGKHFERGRASTGQN